MLVMGTPMTENRQLRSNSTGIFLANTAMKIFVDIRFDGYISLLAKLDVADQKHKQLKEALVIAGGQAKDGKLVITIICEVEAAEALLEFAKKNCPEAVLDIAGSIELFLLPK